MNGTTRSLSLLFGALVIAVLVAPTTAEARGGRGRGARAGPAGAKPCQTLEARFQSIEAVTLTEQEKTRVTYLREEEKLARDVYRTLAKKWSLPVFANIASAEQRHMDHLLLIFNRYKITDPVVDDTGGVFTNQDLAALYDELVTKGSATLVDALQVGARIEDLDIADLNGLLETTKNGHVRLVAQNLVKGSRNHLRAFLKVLAKQGASYTPAHLSTDAFQAILAGAHERGPVNETGAALPTGTSGQARNGQKRRGHGSGRSGRGRCDGSGQGRRGSGQCDGAGPKRDGSGQGSRGRGRGNGQCDGSGPKRDGSGQCGRGRGRGGNGQCDGTGPKRDGSGQGGRGRGRGARGS